ncbi:MAG: DUF1015 domain-containing protein [Phycisphaerales bacterium]
MLRIKPFRALRPTPEKARQVASVPYDVVNREEAAALARGNPDSFLHVVRPEIDLPDEVDAYDDAVYDKGRENLDRLVESGALVREERPSLYLYRQIMNGQPQVGLVCCCHIDDYEQDIIKKHEKTRPKKENDRTRHTLTLNANAGPVFLTYRGRSEIDELVKREMENDPLYDFTAVDGVQHTVWRLEDPAEVTRLFESIDAAYVADGHHRSASAWRAGQERRKANPNHTGDEEYNWFLSVLFPSDQLHILSYNRILRDLNGQSEDEVVTMLSELGDLAVTDDPIPDQPGSFCFYLDGEWRRLILPPESIDRDDPIKSLDVALLEDRVLEPIFGVKDVRTDERIDFVGGIRGAKELERLVDSGEWACAISMYPTSIDQLIAVADAQMVMPPKSTWFEPKLRSGLLVHTLD